MSIDYSFGLMVGFRFSPGELDDVFGKKVPEKSHMEDRFDPKTGKKLAPEKVVDREAGLVYVFQGKELEDGEYHVYEELANAIAGHVGCNYDISGCDGNDMVIFGPSIKYMEEGTDWGHIGTSGPLPLDAVVKAAPKLKQIATKLKKLGLVPGKAGIFITYDVG